MLGGTDRHRRSTGPRARVDRRALVVMTASHAVNHVYVAALAMVYPFVIVEFHATYATLGELLALATLAGGLLQGVAGLAHRVSARLMLIGQNLGMALAAGLGALAPGLGVFGAARVLGGLASWPQHPVGAGYLSDRFPDRRGAVLSWHTAGGSLGTVSVPLVASVVIASFGWRWALAGVTVVLLAGGLVVALLLPGPIAPSAEHPGDPGTPTHPESRRVPLRQVLARPRVLALLAASTIAAGGRGLGTLSTYIPAYLHSGLGMSALAVGGVFTVVMGASVVGPVVAGHIGDRVGRRRLLVTTYVLGAVATTAFGYAGHAGLGWLLLSGVAMGVFAYAESPLIQAVFSDLTGGADSRAAFGVFFAVAYGIGAIWVAVVGRIITAHGFGPAFATMGASFLVAGAIVALVRTGPDAAPAGPDEAPAVQDDGPTGPRT